MSTVQDLVSEHLAACCEDTQHAYALAYVQCELAKQAGEIDLAVEATQAMARTMRRVQRAGQHRHRWELLGEAPTSLFEGLGATYLDLMTTPKNYGPN